MNLAPPQQPPDPKSLLEDFSAIGSCHRSSLTAVGIARGIINPGKAVMRPGRRGPWIGQLQSKE